MFLLVMMLLLVVVGGWLDSRLNWHDASPSDAGLNRQSTLRPEAKEGWV